MYLMATELSIDIQIEKCDYMCMYLPNPWAFYTSCRFLSLFWRINVLIAALTTRRPIQFKNHLPGVTYI